MGQRTNRSIIERCKQVIDFIENYHFKFGFVPSYGDIMDGTGIKSRGHLAVIIEN
jgi:hypothetical protein